MPIPSRAARLGASILALAAALPAWAQDAPVRAVMLFEAGLAELTRATGAAREVTLSVPLRDVNDVLKSLLVRGEGVEGASLTLAGSQPVADAFASLPFPPEAATDLVALLRAVPGLRVRVADRAFPGGQEGTLMGVAEDCSAEEGCETVLTVLHDDGALRRHVFGPGLDLSILDPEIAEALARGLAALRGSASGTMREVAVSLEGEVADGALSYVVAAPAWKTAYRALTGRAGEVDLQAWAVIENATGEDWEDVALTLSSGSPVTLAADLHGRTWRFREVVAPELAVAAAPMARMEAEESFAADAATGGLAAAPAPAPIVAQARGSEGVLDSRFAFPDPVDLAAGEMLSMPFLAGGLEATHLSVWEGALYTRTGNPAMVLEVENDLGVRLPAGIMTVSDESGGYVGDADFPLVAPGETEAVPYGLNRKLRVEETVSETTRRVLVRASGGVLRVAEEQVREVAYVVASPSGEARELAIDHPLASGWTTTVAAGPPGEERQEDDGRRLLRVTIQVPAGAPEGTKLVVRDAYPFEQVIAIGDLGEDDILAWLGEVATDEDRAYLEEAARLAQARSRAQEALSRVEETQRGELAEQERVRRLLGSVENPSEAYDRFLADVLSLDDRIRAGNLAILDARAVLAEAQDAFAAHLEG